MEQQIATLSKLVDAALNFLVSYSFQIVGAIIVLVIGLKLAGWSARVVIGLCHRNNIDVTLARFLGNATKLAVIAFVIIITLGNFGITIAPLIAAIGAAAFGATIAIQGPLANFGAGLSIVLTRPFVVGNIISVKGVTGVVHEITLSATQLIGSNSELITVPNRQIVGEILVNSKQNTIVEATVRIGYGEDAELAMATMRKVLEQFPEIAGEPAAQIGIQDFTETGMMLGLRYWVPAGQLYTSRFAVTRALLQALTAVGIKLQPTAKAAAAPIMSVG